MTVKPPISAPTASVHSRPAVGWPYMSLAGARGVGARSAKEDSVQPARSISSDHQAAIEAAAEAMQRALRPDDESGVLTIDSHDSALALCREMAAVVLGVFLAPRQMTCPTCGGRFKEKARV